MSYRAISQSAEVSRVGLVRLIPVMGKAVKVRRQTVVVAEVGRVARICDRRLFT